MNHCEKCLAYCIPFRRYSENYFKTSGNGTARFRVDIALFSNDFGFTSDSKIPIEPFCNWLMGIVSFLEDIHRKTKPNRITISELFHFILEEKLKDNCCFINFIKNMEMENSSRYIHHLYFQISILKNYFMSKAHRYETIGKLVRDLEYDRCYSESSSEDDQSYKIKKLFIPKEHIRMKVVHKEGKNPIPLETSSFHPNIPRTGKIEK